MPVPLEALVHWMSPRSARSRRRRQELVDRLGADAAAVLAALGSARPPSCWPRWPARTCAKTDSRAFHDRSARGQGPGPVHCGPRRPPRPQKHRETLRRLQGPHRSDHRHRRTHQRPPQHRRHRRGRRGRRRRAEDAAAIERSTAVRSVRAEAVHQLLPGPGAPSPVAVRRVRRAGPTPTAASAAAASTRRGFGVLGRQPASYIGSHPRRFAQRHRHLPRRRDRRHGDGCALRIPSPSTLAASREPPTQIRRTSNPQRCNIEAAVRAPPPKGSSNMLARPPPLGVLSPLSPRSARPLEQHQT